MDEGPQLPAEHAAARLDGLGNGLQPHPPQGFNQAYRMPQGFSYPQAANHAVAAPSAVTNDWASEFQAHNARQAMPNPHGGQPAMQQSMAQTPFQPRPFNGLPDPFVNAAGPQLPMMHQAPITQHAPQSAAPYAPLYEPANRGLDSENRTGIRTDADDEFTQEMDAWMRANGSNLTAEQMANVDAELASFADELNLEAEADRDATIAHIEEQLDLQSPLEQMSLTDLAQAELNSLSATDQALEDSAGPSNADTELAQAAGRLLDSVEHETGDKWANSTFLQLMRDFRDGKKTVVDGDLQEEEEPASDALKGKGPARGPEDHDAAAGGNAGMV